MISGQRYSSKLVILKNTVTGQGIYADHGGIMGVRCLEFLKLKQDGVHYRGRKINGIKQASLKD